MLSPPARIAVLGATGSVGRLIVDRLLALRLAVTAQTRLAARLADVAGKVNVTAFDPVRADGYGRFLVGADAVIFALGTRTLRATTLFSDATRHLLAAMGEAGVFRLVAVTGVGAGKTRGHGGLMYNHLIFPFFTARMYADKDRQERLIAASDLDWTILRPAPFRETVPETEMAVVTQVPADLQLRAITRDEVADMAVRCLTDGLYSRQKVFFGHA
ncbi:MAG: NAD(P)H-binding protein [Pseudomonadota bacterium]